MESFLALIDSKLAFTDKVIQQPGAEEDEDGIDDLEGADGGCGVIQKGVKHLYRQHQEPDEADTGIIDRDSQRGKLQGNSFPCR